MIKSGNAIVASVAQRVRKIRQDMRGNTVIMFGFMLVPIIGFTGLAVDGGRVFMVKSQLSSAVDVTALAAARTFMDPDRDDKAREFFTANFTADLADTKISPVAITPSKSGNTNFITVSANATVPTLFMRVLGIKEVTVNSQAQAARSEVPIELVMALDNTGSMAKPAGAVSRLTALKDASALLVNTLYGDDDTSSKIHIGIIPYTTYVNVGRLPEITGEAPFVAETPGYTNRPVTDALGWKGCVDADATNPNAGDDLTNAAWNTAFDTLDSNPAPPVKASLFPSFTIDAKSATTKCPVPEIQKEFEETNPLRFKETICNEGVCDNIMEPNPDFGKKWKADAGCPVAKVPNGFEPKVFHNTHTYNTGGLDSIYGRPNPPTPEIAAEFDFYEYANAKSWERPALTYASRTTDRSAYSSPQNVYTSATPTSDNYTDGSVVFPKENLSSDPYSAASPNDYCPQQALPLKGHTKTNILGYINSELKAFFPDWGTMSNQGLVWSWRMLSPSLPLAGAPASAGFSKAIVLMTDGALYHPGGLISSGFEKHDGIRTPYGFGSEKTLTNSAVATNTQLVEALRNRLLKTCSNIKKAGITIYTVTVDAGMTADQKSDYRTCATAPNKYFDAPDVTTLKKAFATIADNLSGVRLVK
jgi:Flp pilus assembly protein TadG